MTEKFKAMMLELFGDDYAEVIDYCINETYAYFGDFIELNDLFIVYGWMCENAKNTD